MIMTPALSWQTLTARLLRYTSRHLQFNRRRSLLPVATIATGTLLVYVVLTLIAIVRQQITAMSGTLSPETAAAVSQATVYISLIGLLVGGLETAIVMTRSVLSRIHEIGILKATGVSDRVILSLFLTEAILYGLFGGMIGISLGWMIAAAVQIVSGVEFLTAVLPNLANLVIAFGLAIFTSIAAALIPIWRIGKLSAIQALYHQF
jgi:predicted lysophospholipase L1 biosynthesis ABC-type transport system permease subunit